MELLLFCQNVLHFQVDLSKLQTEAEAWKTCTITGSKKLKKKLSRKNINEKHSSFFLQNQKSTVKIQILF